MAATGDGISDYLISATTVASPLNYSYSFWYKPDHVPNTTDTRQPFSMTNIGGSDGTVDSTFVWDYPDSSIYKGATHREAGGTYRRCQIASTPGSGEYVHIAVTYDGTNIKVYYNGTLEGTTAAAVPHASFNPTFHVCAYSASVGFDTASVAELCVWNTGLTAAQVKSLADGAVPNMIANGNVILYHTLNTGASSTTGPSLTNNGTTLNVSHILGSTGGMVLGANATSITTAYSMTNSGGLVLGGNDTNKIFGTSFATAVSVANNPTDAPYIRQPVSVASAFALTAYRESIESEVNIVSKFSPIVPGVLLSGRTLGDSRR